VGDKLKLIGSQPSAGLAAMFSTCKSVLLIEQLINRGHQALVNKVNSFVVQLQDYVPIRVADKAEAFKLFRRLLNFTHYKADAVPLQRDTFLDFYACDSQIECHRGHLRLDDYYVKVLTLKDAPASTQPNMWRHLQELPSECIVASEFKRMDNFEMRKLIQSKRRHFHNSKTSVMSCVNLSSQLLRLGNERDNATADDALRHLRHARDEFVSRIRSDSDRVDGCSDRPRECVRRGYPKVRLPLVESIQRVMVRAEVFRQTVPADCSLKHTAQRDSVHGATVNAKPENATGELVHDHEDPMGSQCGRFAAEQIAAPQTVLRVAEKCKPGRTS